jgi:hypothetical protein
MDGFGVVFEFWDDFGVFSSVFETVRMRGKVVGFL